MARPLHGSIVEISDSGADPGIGNKDGAAVGQVLKGYKISAFPRIKEAPQRRK
jgi:hypothetical protein